MKDPSSVPEPSAGAEDAILPLPGPRRTIVAASSFRSTWVVSSIESLRNVGHFERYTTLLDEHRDEILGCVAGVWLPMAVAASHYRACESLGLSIEEQTAMSHGDNHTRRAWYASLIASAERTETTPWTILPLLNRMWLRGADGGAVGVFRLGPKQARVEYVGCELFEIKYFRHAVRSVLLSLVERIGTKPVVNISPQPTKGECAYVVRWE